MLENRQIHRDYAYYICTEMRTLSLCLLILSFCSATQAQNRSRDTGRRNSTPVGGETVTTAYHPDLIKTDKKTLMPNIPKMNTVAPSFNYNLEDFRWNTRKLQTILPPQETYEKGADSLYNPNYARLGIGNYFHKLGEIYISNRANPKYAYNIALQHLSADEDKTIRDFSTNKAHVSLARFFNRSSVSIRGHYLRDMNRFFAKDTLWVGENIRDFKKINQNAGGLIQYDLRAVKGKPGFSLGAKFNNFYNNLNQSETEFGAKGGWEFILKKVFKVDLKTYGEVNYTYLRYRQRFDNTEQQFLDIKPRVYFVNKESGFEGWGGLNFTYIIANKSNIQGGQQYNIAPYLYAEKKLEGLKMKFFLGVDGGFKPQSIRRFTEWVPFTYDTIRMENTFETVKVKGGLKGRITENSQFLVQVGYDNINNQPFVISGADTIKALNIIYDNMNVIYFSGDLRFSLGEQLRAGLTARLNNFQTSAEADAWHLPSAQFSILAQYLLKRSFVFELGLNGNSAKPNRKEGGANSLSVKGFADLHARVDYIIKNRVRVWIQGSNLTNQRYQVWYGYNNYRLTILGGLAASF